MTIQILKKNGLFPEHLWKILIIQKLKICQKGFSLWSNKI